MSAPRLRDWQSRLAALLADRRAAPFEWALNDCCSFAADCVLAVTGVDPGEGLRGRYLDEAGALALLQELGGVRGFADSRIGSRIKPLQARVGDVGMGRTPGGMGLVVCIGLHWTGPGPTGLLTLPQDHVARFAWKVG